MIPEVTGKDPAHGSAACDPIPADRVFRPCLSIVVDRGSLVVGFRCRIQSTTPLEWPSIPQGL